MGEYFRPVNLDKRQFLEPHELGTGMKLGQICFTSPGVAAIVLWLLLDQWKGDRVALVGDESDCVDEIVDSYQNISSEVALAFAERFRLKLIPDPSCWGEWKEDV